jgi:transcriptional regulator of acetoin/glycerol metabolism
MWREGSTTVSVESTTAPTDPSLPASRSKSAVHPGLVAIFPQDPEAVPAIWSVGKVAVLGRAQDADVRLGDATVSRRHAQLERIETGLRVTELGSHHGTFVDGEPVGRSGLNAPYGAILRTGGALSLVSDDVTQYRGAPRRIAAGFLGMQRDILGGPALCRVWQQAAAVAALSHPVLIQGETGSGKEAVARLIHAMRKEPGPFVALNLAAVPDGLFESELFGHVRGSFTGATSSRVGAFCQASGGVLFIDEVADLRIELQVKLLRAIDQLRVRPVGADQDVEVNTRIVAATSQDLRQASGKGCFRLDLYYRLAGVVMRVPPLRERRSDILTLATSFLAHEHPKLSLSVCAAEALALARWQGNVRELYHALTRAAVAALTCHSTTILLEHLPELEGAFSDAEAQADTPLTLDVVETALIKARGNASLAAKSLGVSRSTFYNILKREGIAPASLRPQR